MGLEATFKRFDKDNSGYITLADLQKIFGPSFDTKQFEKLIREVDTNGDGKIEVAEFISFMRHGASDEQKEIALTRIDTDLHSNGGNLGDCSPMTPVRYRKRDKFADVGKQVAARLGFGDGA